MDSTFISSLITGAGVAGVFCILFVLRVIVPWKSAQEVIADKDRLIAELKAEKEAERDRADTATTALYASRDTIGALQTGLNAAAAAQAIQARLALSPPLSGAVPSEQGASGAAGEKAT